MASPSRGPSQNPKTNNRAIDSTAMRPGTTPQHRHRNNDETWVEVSSHPSSSSVSSIGDEIVTTGLRVGNPYPPRRGRLHPQSYANRAAQKQHTSSASALAGRAGTSSQEEYEESDSEDDQILTSSTENIIASQVAGGTPLRRVHGSRRHRESDFSDEDDDDDDDDDDENATALGRRPPEPFRPQPNAFSHPPSHLAHRHSTSSAIPTHHHRPSLTQRSSTRVDRRTPNPMSPSYQADNDAALRASLTTLLSCAAAARGRPKNGEEKVERPGPATSNQPVELRVMPESELMTPAPAPAQPRETLRSPGTRATPPSGPSREATGEKIKRSATPTSGTKPARATKKKKTASSEEAVFSPTLLTWVVSAGVVVFVVGFGAGYVIGREIGRQESLTSLSAGGNASVFVDGSSCGREVVRGGGGALRKFRWGTGIISVAT
ncbi:hypothetical protein DL766_008506 [Monosporascus sp. MC13-8B]|uniref:Uncharacterized protein n=1 Tax=Monosporascus cannonballus TaxID=155416 RepID=A0ABY0H668_9PEZI|nr:hypothetical protein DL762_006039 [Monosporascus cannonballus]RYP19154.1 hypothetical protein DL766_008506 [Monosporascus sp. MC13-8B]